MRLLFCAVWALGCRVDRVAHVAQLVEHILGKDEVSGSIPLVGSIFGTILVETSIEGRCLMV